MKKLKNVDTVTFCNRKRIVTGDNLVTVGLLAICAGELFKSFGARSFGAEGDDTKHVFGKMYDDFMGMAVPKKKKK